MKNSIKEKMKKVRKLNIETKNIATRTTSTINAWKVVFNIKDKNLKGVSRE